MSQPIIENENGILQGGDRLGNAATGALLGYAVSGNGRGAAAGALIGTILGGEGDGKRKRSRRKRSPRKPSKSKGKSRSMTKGRSPLKGGACPQKCSANWTRNKYSGKLVYGKHQFVENYLQSNGYLNYHKQNGWICNYCYCVTH